MTVIVYRHGSPAILYQFVPVALVEALSRGAHTVECWPTRMGR